MKSKTNYFWVLLFLQCLSISAIAQWAGGSGNGRSPSSEVKASSINAGGVSAEVNLFTGTLNTSHALGTVSTPSGLSFTASLSHNSTFAAGDNLPHSTGIPYGEGWNLGLPMISINTEDFAKYSIGEKTTISRSNTPDRTEIYMERTVNNGQVVFNCSESEEEGLLYYYSPELSIPGYGGGRLVFKEKDGQDYVFVLNAFEQYVEARLRNGIWIVTMDDGTIFKMSKRILAHRNPSNQRVQSACHQQDIIANLHLPKTEYLSWYCEVIKHPLKKGKIEFEYEPLGCFNFFDVYDLYGRDIMSFFFGQNVSIQKLPEACKDIFINKIYSETNELVFNYEDTQTPTAGENLPGPNDEDFDNLYGKIEVQTYSGNDFENSNWHRYHHIKSKNVDLGCTQKLNFTNPLNPYVGENSSFLEKQYARQTVENQFYGVPFDHGYLESDRIGNNLPPGDIYELETTIRNNNGGICLFDINVATGDARIPENIIATGSANNEFLSKGCYEARTGESVYNTFNKAFKWPSTYNNYDQVTRDLFVMPNHPPQYQGFHIQIGPSNSDNKFSKTPTEVFQENMQNAPDPCTSYFERLYPNPSNPETENIQNALMSGASIPQNFGIGLPWHVLKDFYDVELGLNPCPTPTTPAVGFWWNHTVDVPSDCVNATKCDLNGFDWNNEPTCAVFCGNEAHPNGIYLNDVKLYRYAKKPYMLSSVEYKEKNTSDIFVLKQKLSFTYDVKLVDRYAPAFASFANGGGQELNFLKNGKRNIFILTSIIQEPVNGSFAGPKPTTSFEYYTTQEVANIVDDCAEENTLFHNTNFVLLNKIIDPLGKETDFDYHPFSDILKISPTGDEIDGTDSYSLASFFYTPRPGEQDAVIPGSVTCFGEVICGSPLAIQPGKPYAYQTYAVVLKKKVKDHSGVEKVWTYEYSNLKVKGDQISFAENFQYDRKFSRTAGYEKTTVKGPSFNGIGFIPSMTVKHFQDNLLWGKVNKVVNRDIYNNVVSATVSKYETLMVYDGAANLASNSEHPDFSLEANMYDVPRFFESRQWPASNTFNDHYLNSFFIKKVEEKETILDSGQQMRTITSYDYFDADHNKNTTSPGFAAMGISSPLTFEPSYRLYKQRTIYSALPDAYSEEEYFYLYDLINHPDHQATGGLLEDIADNWKIRSFPFETRTTNKSSADTPISHSQYNIYSTDWNGALNGKLFPKKVVQKVEPNYGDILEFDPVTFEPDFPYKTLELTTINDRNLDGQILMQTNEKGLQTQTAFNAVGLPELTTTGLGVNGAQTTRIIYNSDNTIDAVIDPNGTKLEYSYDPFLRLNETKRNGLLLQDVTYNYWDNDQTKTFEERTDNNFIETNNYVSGTQKWYERAFVDPLGRPAALVKEGVVLENNLYDTWDRPVLKMKPELGTSPVHGLSYNNFLHLNIQYDGAPRNRPLKSAKYGELLNGHTVNTAYSIISHTDLIAELTPSGQIVLPEGYFFYKTATTDEDGKVVITYANQLGQTVATLAKNGEVSTVFRYDSQGNVMEVINPLNQINNYDYNYLGQLYRSTTVDDGTTLFGYNSSGELIGQEFANGQKRLYQYDIFNRPIHQVSVQTTGSLLTNNGMAWTLDNQFETTLNNLINSPSSTFEKKYFYNAYDIGGGAYPGNALPYLQNSQTNTLGRLAQTTSYDLTGTLTENRWYSYNEDGFLRWEMMQFKLPGTSDKGRLVRIDYKDYNRQGSFETQNVDLNGDNTLDFQYRYKYDNWNRLKKVYTNYDSPDNNNGYKVVSYDYDDVIGTVKKKTYFDSTVDNNSGNNTSQCENVSVDEVEYFYDQRFRLTDITSHLFDWKLYYDNNMDAQHTGNFTANFNGNINTSRAIYKQENTNNFLIEQMTGPTIYNYQYDNLNRLVNADAKVIQNVDTPNTIPCGDANYTYDKAGNFQELVRCNNPYLFPNPNYIYTYDYTPGTNRLNTVTTETGAVYNYTYDGSGNVLTDTKRGITMTTYGRAHLPWKIQKQENGNTQYINYLYDTNDQRIFKALSSSAGSLSREYYIRTSGGQELAIYNINDNKLTWNVYGNERVAKIEHQPSLIFTATASDDSPFICGNGILPFCTEEESGAQNQSLQVLANNWITNPNVLNLPTNLYRIRLCNGAELYILDQELTYLVGNYLILQTIAINTLDDLFTLSSPPGGSLPGEVIVDLEEMLNARFTYEGIWINGYNPCDPFDGDLVELESPPIPNLFFYLYDHLGNTRVVYSTEFDCGSDIIYSSQSMIDYFPYGKIFREKSSGQEKYLTTQHERDVETGLDYRGARFYDSDIGRFLSLDPLAADFASWSPYNYVLGNPNVFTDPKGTSPEFIQFNQLQLSDPPTTGPDKEDEPDQRGAVGLDDFIETIRKSGVNSLLELRDFYKGYKGSNIGERGQRNRYLYSTKWGWIDMKHFASAAAGANIYGANRILKKGERLEKEQLQSKRRGEQISAFSFEDLVSNLVGAAFNDYDKVTQGPYRQANASLQFPIEDKISVLEGFLKEIGVVNNPIEVSPIKISINTDRHANGIKNTGYTPIHTTQPITNSGADKIILNVRDNFLKN